MVQTTNDAFRGAYATAAERRRRRRNADNDDDKKPSRPFTGMNIGRRAQAASQGRSNYVSAAERRAAIARNRGLNKDDGKSTLRYLFSGNSRNLRTNRQRNDDAASQTRTRREKAFATSQKAEIDRRFGGDVDLALAAMRRQDARNKNIGSKRRT